MTGNTENGQWKNAPQGDDRASSVHDTKTDAQSKQSMTQLLAPIHLVGNPGQALREMREGERA